MLNNYKIEIKKNLPRIKAGFLKSDKKLIIAKIVFG
jgi:hypothetical protein